MKRISSIISGIAMMVPFAAAAQGNDYPTQPIRIIVPFSAGGIVDSVARIVGQKISTQLGKPVIVENRTGAGGAVGTSYVARSAPDGYTILCVSPGFVVDPDLVKDATWSPVRDFRGVEGVGLVSNVFVVPSSSPVKNMPELIALARKNAAAPLTFADAGTGTSNHLSGLLLAQMAGIKLTEVSYRGQPDALNDLVAGRVAMMPLTAALAKPQIQQGTLRPLAVTTATRSSALPEVPTLAQAIHLPGYDVSTWFGFVAPAKTPERIVNTLSAAIAQALNAPEVKAKLTFLAMDLAPRDPKQFDRYIAAENAKWSDVLAKAGFKPQ